MDELKRWEVAKTALERAKSELNKADCELKNAENALGRSMLPKNYKTGETFQLWTEDRERIIVVYVADHNTFSVKYREG